MIQTDTEELHDTPSTVTRTTPRNAQSARLVAGRPRATLRFLPPLRPNTRQQPLLPL